MSSKLLSRLPRPSSLSSPRPTLLTRRASTSTSPSSTHTPSLHPPRRSLVFTAGLALGSLLTGYALALAAPRPPLLSLLFPVPTALAPPHDSDEGRAHAERIERELQGLNVVRELRGRRVEGEGVTGAGSGLEKAAGEKAAGGERTEVVSEFTEARPYSKGAGPHSLTGYSLRGPGK